jgi:zinc transporter 1/2/3
MRYLLHVAAAAAARDAHAGHSHAGHSHAGHSHADHGAAALAAAAAPAENTLDLRIAAIFVVWAGALVFGLPPLLFKQFKNPDALVPRLLRAFAGGTIIALALVHIIPESVEQLHDVIEYHLAGCTVLFGMLVLLLIDNSLAACLAPEAYKQQLRAELAANKAHTDGAVAAVPSTHKLAAAGSSTCGGGSHSHPRQPSAAAAPPADTAARSDLTSIGKGGDAVADIMGSSDTGNLDAVRSAASQSHGHQCLRSLNATGWVLSVAGPMRNVRQYVTAYTMELGCIFHSIIIGVGVGVITGACACLCPGRVGARVDGWRAAGLVRVCSQALSLPRSRQPSHASRVCCCCCRCWCCVCPRCHPTPKQQRRQATGSWSSRS